MLCLACESCRKPQSGNKILWENVYNFVRIRKGVGGVCGVFHSCHKKSILCSQFREALCASFIILAMAMAADEYRRWWSTKKKADHVREKEKLEQKIADLETQLHESLEERCKLQEGVMCMQTEKEKLEEKITELEMQLSESLDEERNLQEEAVMLMQQLGQIQRVSAHSSRFLDESTPSLPLLRDASTAVHEALLLCAVALSEQVSPSIYNNGQQFMFHRQLSSCLFCDFEAIPFNSQSLSLLQRSEKDFKQRLFKEFLDYGSQSAEKLFAVQQVAFRNFYTSRLHILKDMCRLRPFSSLEKRQLELSRLLKNEKCPLFGEFARLAKAVWLLNKLAFAFQPTAYIFRVSEGALFDPKYMDKGNTSVSRRVHVMTSPGFMIRDMVIKAQVQLGAP